MNKKKNGRKTSKTLLSGLLTFAMTMSYLYIPNPLRGGENVAEAFETGNSRTFNNTSTGYSGANTNNSSGTLGGTITMSGGMYNWTVPETGIYKIEAYGAEGGSTAHTGGKGTVMKGDFTLTKGQVIKILVGQEGVTPASTVRGAGGGGGGTFVTTSYDAPLIVAGGGGGAGRDCSAGVAVTTVIGGNSTCSNTSYGGTLTGAGVATTGSYGGGSGGGANSGNGVLSSTGGGLGATGGAGFTGNGSPGQNSHITPNSFKNGGSGGYHASSSYGAANAYGGFGGGAAGTLYSYQAGGGGGGGYTGGGGGSGLNVGGGGGGGGSYNAGINQSNTAGANAGHGQVIITQLLPTIASQAPANSTKFQDSYIDVSWVGESMPSGASISRYDIQAGTTSGGSNILALTNKGTGTSHRITVPAGTPGNTTIYWRVRAYDHGGNVGPWKEQTVIYANNVPSVTATTNTPAKLDVSLQKRQHAFSINSIKDPDDFNYVTFFADVLDQNGSVIAGSKQQIVLDSSLVSSASLISGTATEKDGSLQGPVNHTTPFNLKVALQPNFTNGTFDLTLTKADGTTNVIKGGKKLLTGRAMQASSAPNPENFTLRIYPEDRQNTNGLAASPLAGVNDVTPIVMPFTSDTRNYLPNLTNVQNDVANRVFSDAEGFNRISVSGHVDDSDLADKVTVYYEVQPKASNYSIQVATVGGKVVPKYGKAAQSFNPKVDHDFKFTYQVASDLDSGNYALLVYGYDSQEGIGDYIEISFTVDRGGPTIDFIANYQTASGQTIVMSTAQKQVVAEDNKAKLYFTPNNYATFEYAGYLVRGNTVKDLRIRGAFTNNVKATFIGVDFGKDPITLLNGEQTDFQLGDIVVFRFKATSATGIVTEKDVRILIGNDQSTFSSIQDSSLPAIP